MRKKLVASLDSSNNARLARFKIATTRPSRPLCGQQTEQQVIHHNKRNPRKEFVVSSLLKSRAKKKFGRERHPPKIRPFPFLFIDLSRDRSFLRRGISRHDDESRDETGSGIQPARKALEIGRNVGEGGSICHW